MDADGLRDAMFTEGSGLCDIEVRSRGDLFLLHQRAAAGDDGAMRAESCAFAVFSSARECWGCAEPLGEAGPAALVVICAAVPAPEFVGGCAVCRACFSTTEALREDIEAGLRAAGVGWRRLNLARPGRA